VTSGNILKVNFQGVFLAIPDPRQFVRFVPSAICAVQKDATPKEEAVGRGADCTVQRPTSDATMCHVGSFTSVASFFINWQRFPLILSTYNNPSAALRVARSICQSVCSLPAMP
jgi:hypothetical protein